MGPFSPVLVSKEGDERPNGARVSRLTQGFEGLVPRTPSCVLERDKERLCGPGVGYLDESQGGSRSHLLVPIL